MTSIWASKHRFWAQFGVKIELQIEVQIFPIFDPFLGAEKMPSIDIFGSFLDLVLGPRLGCIFVQKKGVFRPKKIQNSAFSLLKITLFGLFYGREMAPKKLFFDFLFCQIKPFITPEAPMRFLLLHFTDFAIGIL